MLVWEHDKGVGPVFRRDVQLRLFRVSGLGFWLFEEGRLKATWKREFKFPRRKAGPRKTSR